MNGSVSPMLPEKKNVIQKFNRLTTFYVTTSQIECRQIITTKKGIEVIRQIDRNATIVLRPLLNEGRPQIE